MVYEVDQDGNACEGERHAKRHGNMRYETRTLGAPHRAQHKKTIDEGCNESAKHNLIAPVAHEVAQQTRAEKTPDHVVGVIAQHRRRPQRGHEPQRLHGASTADRAGDEQQRIAGKKRRHDQAGFAKHDQKKKCVNPGSVLGDERAQMLIEMHDNIDQLQQPVEHDYFPGSVEREV